MIALAINAHARSWWQLNFCVVKEIFYFIVLAAHLVIQV
jgi:hypothetical protein